MTPQQTPKGRDTSIHVIALHRVLFFVRLTSLVLFSWTERKKGGLHLAKYKSKQKKKKPYAKTNATRSQKRVPHTSRVVRATSYPFLFSVVIYEMFPLLWLEAVIWKMFFYYPVINVSSLQLLLPGASHSGRRLVSALLFGVYLRWSPVFVANILCSVVGT